MAGYFVDSSALVKRYVQETGTGWVRGITRHSPTTIIYIARITAVELTCAVAVAAKAKRSRPGAFPRFSTGFGKHLDGRYVVVEVTPSLLDDAMPWAMPTRFAPTTPCSSPHRLKSCSLIPLRL